MNTKQKRFFLLTVTIFLFLGLTGCLNPFEDSGFSIPAGKGSFSLMLSDAPRTVLPTAPALNDFAVYNLSFTPTNDGSAENADRTNETLVTNPIFLEAGTYNLVVNAYKDTEKNQLAARGTLTGIVITTGKETSAAVTLEALLLGGTGIFKWDITVPTGVTASMIIMPGNTDGTNQETVALNPPKSLGNRTLNSGPYNLIINLTKADGKSAVWNELLYVYRNLDSIFTFTFTDAHFSDSAYNVIFNYNGVLTSNQTQSVLHNAALLRPDTPIRNGYIFTGWYTDNGVWANPWDFNNPVIQSFTLYAKWEIVPITDVSIAVMPPVMGGAPVNMAYGTGNFTIGAVSWAPAHNPFQDNTPYTATVALTADNGYTFTGLTSVIINGQNSTVTTNIGSVVMLSYAFPATDNTAVNKFLANSYTANDRIKYSFSYGEYDFYYIYLGGIANVPVYTFPVKQHNGQPGNTYAVSMSNQTITTVEETVTNHTENTKTTIEENSYSSTTGAKLKTEVSAKAGLFGMGVETKVSTEASWQNYIAHNFTLINEKKTSLTQTVSHASTYAYTTTVTDSFDLGYRKAGYYRYTLFSASDVYLYVIRNSSTNKLEYYEFKEHIVPDVFFWALDYSDTPSFIKSDATSFSLDISVLDNLPRPSLHVGRFPVTNTVQWNNTLDFIRNGGNGTVDAPKTYEIFVSGNVSVPGSAATGTSLGSLQYVEVTLKGDGRLSLNSNGSILCLGNNQKLIVEDERLTLQGRSGNDKAVLYAGSGGTLELKKGVISGNTVTNGSGGGVSSSGTFNMSGGTISGNTAHSGSGVYSDAGGTFTKSLPNTQIRILT